MIKVYVAGPLSTGKDHQGALYDAVCMNVRQAIDAGSQLMKLGFAPFVPHYSHFGNLFHFHEWGEWMAIDKVWVEACDCLLRLPGPSKGADQEVVWAQAARVPVFTDINSLVEWAKGR